MRGRETRSEREREREREKELARPRSCGLGHVAKLVRPPSLARPGLHDLGLARLAQSGSRGLGLARPRLPGSGGPSFVAGSDFF